VVTALFQSVAVDTGFQQFKQNHSNYAFSKLLRNNGSLLSLDNSGLKPPRHITDVSEIDPLPSSYVR
jgi:hypothetical protein